MQRSSMWAKSHKLKRMQQTEEETCNKAAAATRRQEIWIQAPWFCVRGWQHQDMDQTKQYLAREVLIFNPSSDVARPCLILHCSLHVPEPSTESPQPRFTRQPSAIEWKQAPNI